MRNESFDYFKGTKRVLFTAPHAVEHEREGETRFSEPETGILVEKFWRDEGYFGLVKNDRDKSDPNFDEVSAFRDKAVSIVEENHIMVGIDFHQLSCKRSTDVIIGTGHGKNIQFNKLLLETLCESLEAENIKFVVDELFAAAGKFRVSTDVAKRARIPYFQFEMNSCIFPEKREDIFRAIRCFIDEVLQ